MALVPVGFDTADGQSGRLGTATPVGTVVVDTSAGNDLTPDNASIEESPDSPVIERAEQATFQKTFTMPWAEAVNRIQFHYRGQVMEDSYGFLYKVLSARAQRQKGEQATLTLVLEAASFDAPPDEFSIVPVELGLNILKHPRYFKAFLGDGYGSTTEQRNQMVVRILQDYMNNVSYAFRNSVVKLLYDSLGSDAGSGAQPPPQNQTGSYWFASGAKISGTDMAKRAAMEIVQKIWRGEETPYVVGWRVTHSYYLFRPPPTLNPGGYIEDPILDATPQIPDYFYSPDYPPNPVTSFFQGMTALNPQCYASNGMYNGDLSISWLRKADVLDYQRTWFKVTRTWDGSPIGHWDEDLYTSGNRPQVAGDYRVINPYS